SAHAPTRNPAKSSAGPGTAGSTMPASPPAMRTIARAQRSAVVIAAAGPRGPRARASGLVADDRAGRGLRPRSRTGGRPVLVARLRRDQHLAEGAVLVERRMLVDPGD